MILHEFPDLSWLRQQVEQGFRSQQGWRGVILPRSGWPTVVLNVKARQIYRNRITGPVSLFTNLRGGSLVTAENRTVRVPDEYFFMTNQRQEYTLAAHESSLVETFNIHFGEYFLDQLYSTAVIQSGKLLENPLGPTVSSVGFFNRLHRKDAILERVIQQLQAAEPGDTLLTEEILVDLGLHLLDLHRCDLRRMHALPPVKAATRAEIYRRLSRAIDYIYTFYHRSLSLDELAGVALLSKFHFLRLFRAAFRETPHQFVTRLRLEKAQKLLQHSDHSVQSIAEQIGLDHASSVSRLFRQRMGVYPTAYREAVRK